MCHLANATIFFHAIHQYTHTQIYNISFLHLSSYECKCAMRPSDRALWRIYRCSASPTDVPAPPPLQPPLTASYPSCSPSCQQWQQIRHDCSRTRFELSRVKSLLKLRDICRALSRICWQSYIVYTTLFSVHKSYANSLAEREEGKLGEVKRYSSVTLFVLIGVKLQ